ncbi:MAG: acetate--CoA ligase family protein, partial [Kiritimatiellia bacterium]|nr:acetate--CoA ligase family protein [Kiritimatiellia bacterium]
MKTGPIWEQAIREGRNSLLEHEVYALLDAAGIAIPRHLFIPRARWNDPEVIRELAQLSEKKIVLKISAPDILHKTDVGGIETAPCDESALRQALARLAERFSTRPVRGILACEFVESDFRGWGSEILLGARETEEWGPVLTLGAGGVDTEFFNRYYEGEHAFSIEAAALLDTPEALRSFALHPALIRKLLGQARDKHAFLSESDVVSLVARFRDLLLQSCEDHPESPVCITQLEINPLLLREGRLIAVDGLCTFRPPRPVRASKPLRKLENLFHPKSAAVIGVSEKMNIGRGILRKMAASGFPRERLFVIKPGLDEIDGCRCVNSVRDLPDRVDLLVIAVSAQQAPDV